MVKVRIVGEIHHGEDAPGLCSTMLKVGEEGRGTCQGVSTSQATIVLSISREVSNSVNVEEEYFRKFENHLAMADPTQPSAALSSDFVSGNSVLLLVMI